MNIDLPTDDGVLELHPDSPLRRAALEVEQHVAEAGWDQPPRLFALVRTAELVAKQPALADQVGDGADGSLTPIEQDGVQSVVIVSSEGPTPFCRREIQGGKKLSARECAATMSSASLAMARPRRCPRLSLSCSTRLRAVTRKS